VTLYKLNHSGQSAGQVVSNVSQVTLCIIVVKAKRLVIPGWGL